MHKLVRALREVALDATSDSAEGRPNAAETLVATDIFEHSPTTVSEIVARTGVAQSQVSTIAAALHDAGITTREPDPRDRRRTLLVVPAKARKAFGTDRGRRGIQSALATYLDAHQLPSTPAELDEVNQLLEQLSARLGVNDRFGRPAPGTANSA